VTRTTMISTPCLERVGNSRTTATSHTSQTEVHSWFPKKESRLPNSSVFFAHFRLRFVTGWLKVTHFPSSQPLSEDQTRILIK
jgi:hypothetical protein